MHINEFGTFSPNSALSRDTIDLWLARIDVAAEELEGLVSILNEEERARQGRYRLPSVGRCFAAARVFLRQVLAIYLGIAPAELRIRYETQGKPFLDHPTNLQFNLAHTESAAAIAVARRRKVGVDLEAVRNDLDFNTIARSYFSEAEARELLSRGSNVPDAFFRHWTAKESYLKAIGDGLIVPLDSFEVSPVPEGQADRFIIKTQPENGRWTSCVWQPRPELYCAVTSEGTDWSITIQSVHETSFPPLLVVDVSPGVLRADNPICS